MHFDEFARTHCHHHTSASPRGGALLPFLLAPFLIGAFIFLIGMKWHQEKVVVDPPSNPLQVSSALQMAVAFQIVLFAIFVVRSRWGNAGVFLSGAFLG